MPFPQTEKELAEARYQYESTGQCSGPNCGRTILWYRTPNGKRMPMDEETHRPHWSSCPDTRKFRKKGDVGMNNSEYQEYLASREWALKKQRVRERSKGRCERCLTGDYNSTHHLTYERIGNEDLADLVAVCNACHAYLSGTSGDDPAFYLASVLKRSLDALQILCSRHVLFSEALAALGYNDQAELLDAFCEKYLKEAKPLIEEDLSSFISAGLNHNLAIDHSRKIPHNANTTDQAGVLPR